MLQNTIQYQINFWDSFSKESFRKSGAFVFATGLQTPLINLIILEQQNIESLQSVLPKAQNFFGKHDVPWGVNIIHNESDNEIITFLKNNGFENIRTQFQMETKIDFLPDDFVAAYDIKQVSNTNMLLDWLIPIASAFEIAATDSDLYYKLANDAFNARKIFCEHFVLYIDNKPVSSSTLTITNNVARLDNVATVKELQNQGFGQEIIGFSIEKARKYGAKHIVFESSEAGINLYKKMGFIEINISSIHSLSKIL